MKAIILASLASITFASIISSASVLKSGTTVQEKENVKIPQTVTLKLAEKETTLGLVGSGLRKKSFLGVKVYLVEIFADKVDSFVRKNEKALDSLNASETVAVRVTFLRNVDAETIMNAFKDGFSVNYIDVNKDQPIKEFLSAVGKGGDGDEGKTLTFVLVKNPDGTITLSYEDSKGKIETIAGTASFSKKILSLWLGKMIDSKAQDMQNEIVSGK